MGKSQLRNHCYEQQSPYEIAHTEHRNITICNVESNQGLTN